MEPSSSAPRSRIAVRDIWFSRALAALSLGLFIYWLAETLRGVPDAYHNQHSRGLLLTAAMFIQNIGQEFKLKRLGWVLMGVCVVLLAWVIVLSA